MLTLFTALLLYLIKVIKKFQYKLVFKKRITWQNVFDIFY